ASLFAPREPAHSRCRVTPASNQSAPHPATAASRHGGGVSTRPRRQQVMPLPQPISWGSISHGMPLFKTKTMPSSAARCVTLRGRPPLGLGGSGGKSGAMISHSVSLISGVLMSPIYHTAEVLLGALRDQQAPVGGPDCEHDSRKDEEAEPHVLTSLQRAGS